jgi:hypothetical protein
MWHERERDQEALLSIPNIWRGIWPRIWARVRGLAVRPLSTLLLMHRADLRGLSLSLKPAPRWVLRRPPPPR